MSSSSSVASTSAIVASPSASSRGGSLLSRLRLLRKQQHEANRDFRQNNSNSGSEGPAPAASMASAEASVSAPPTDLERRIIRQVEFYFGDYNLPKDRFMLDKMEEHDGAIPMEVMMTFKRLRDLTHDPDAVMTALDKSDSGLVQVDRSHGRGRLRRHAARPLPAMTEDRKAALQERTVFVGGFDRELTVLDDLIAFFEDGFDKVCNVRMRYTRVNEDDNNNNIKDGGDDDDERDNRRFLGSVFVTFASRQAAADFLAVRPLEHKGRKLFSKWQRDFFLERGEYNDSFNRDTIDRTVWVHGFDKMDTSEETLAKFFGTFRGADTIRKRVYRDLREANEDGDGASPEWGFTGSAFVTFKTRKAAQAFVDTGDKLNFQGDRLRCMWQRDFYAEKGRFRRELDKLKKEEEEEERE